MDKQPKRILYVQPKCPISKLLVLELQKFPSQQITITNALDVNPRPKWLIGTPTLEDLSVNMRYAGSDALLYISNLMEAIESTEKKPTNPMDDLFQSPNIEILESESRYTDKPDKESVSKERLATLTRQYQEMPNNVVK